VSVEIDLSDMRLLVVGGSAGIGRSLAIAAARDGASVAIVGRNEAKLAEVVDAAEGITAIAADIREPERCASLVGEAVDELGGLDALVVS
jgi:3-oxoacyl-[acyl-carrier protein] reductase